MAGLSSRYLISRLLRTYLKGHAGRLLLAIICMILVAAATAGNAWMMEPVLDKVFVDKDQSKLYWIAGIVLLLALIKGVASYGQNFMMGYIGQRMVIDMQSDLYKHLLHADLSLYQQEASGKLVSRFSNDIVMLRGAVVGVLINIARDVFSLIFLLGVMFYQSLALTLIIFVVFPVAIYPIVRLGKRMRKISRQTQEELGGFTEQLDETFSGIRVIKAYQKESFEAQRAQTMLEKVFGHYVKSARNSALASPIMEGLGGIAIAAVILYGGLQVVEGTTTAGSFFSFIAALIMAYRPLKGLSNLNTILQNGLAAAERIFAILDVTPKICDAKDAKELHSKDPTITFDKVAFSYDEKALALQDISLSIKPGQKIALVGASGAGKTTLFQLLLRFYDVSQGAVTIDGVDIRDMKIESLRSHMAIVSQDITLFDDSVAANIAYGDTDIPLEKIKQAAKAAAADEFIEALPEGYDTILGPSGARLSGGQRQRIAIARAFMKDAPILLLDEATSALDTVSEKHIQQALVQLMEQRTTIMIAHRLSTIMHADVIYVLDKGRIVEQGKHNELLTQSGHYAKLYQEFTSDTPES